MFSQGIDGQKGEKGDSRLEDNLVCKLLLRTFFFIPFNILMSTLFHNIV